MSSLGGLELREAYGGYGVAPKPPRPTKKAQKRFIDAINSSLAPEPAEEDAGGGAAFVPSAPPRLPPPPAAAGAIEPFAGFFANEGSPATSTLEAKLDRVLRLMEAHPPGLAGASERGGSESPQDVILYSFTGVFLLFVLDAFVALGRRGRRGGF